MVDLDSLLNKMIGEVWLAQDHSAIKFETDQGPVVFEVEGDCCSDSWIEGVDDPEALIGFVSGVEQIEMPDLGSQGTDFHPHADVICYYGLRITTTSGRAVIDFRNDSNGYYGGSIGEVDPDCFVALHATRIAARRDLPPPPPPGTRRIILH